jgi:hypothetical protein
MDLIHYIPYTNDEMNDVIQYFKEKIDDNKAYEFDEEFLYTE